MTEEEIPSNRKALTYIITYEFCEKLSYYGIRTILVLFVSEKLTMTDAESKVIVHTFYMLVYSIPIISGFISDSFLGKYKTILYGSLIFACGNILLVLAAADPIPIPRKGATLFSLLLIAAGTGTIMPCIAAIGGDQFVLPAQERQLDTFFSLFYMAINVGSMFSTFVTPILRSRVHCFGQHNCYMVGFAAPGAFMFFCIIIIAMAKPSLKIVKPKGNILIEVIKCIKYALTHRKVENPGNHWLDRSTQEFGAELVHDVKILLKVLVLYIPIPFFWALYDQEGSGWILQGVKMNGDCGLFTIYPDQMQVLNPLLIIPLLPFFSYVVYPIFAKCGFLKKPLQRMTCGGFIAALSFLVTTLISLALEADLPILPVQGEAHVRIYNPTNCKYSFSTADNVIPEAEINGYYLTNSVKVASGSMTVNFTFSAGDSTSDSNDCKPREIQMEIKDKTSYGIYITDTKEGYFEDVIEKSEDGFPRVRVIISDSSIGAKFIHVSEEDDSVVSGPGDVSLHTVKTIGVYKIDIITNAEIDFKLGGTYTVMINKELNTATTIIVVKANTMHILWLVPQYFIITVAEVMLGVTGLTFSYEEAPVSMKAVIQACWCLTAAIGNFLIVLVELMKLFELESLNFLVYTVLMVADMLLFMVLAIRYKSPTVEVATANQ